MIEPSITTVRHYQRTSLAVDEDQADEDVLTAHAEPTVLVTWM